MNRRRFLTLLTLTALAAPLPSALLAQAPPEPTADDIQRLVRFSYIGQDMTLNGKLRNSTSGTEAPFVLTMQENTIRFRFDAPTQIINLDLNDKGFILREVVRGKNAPVPQKRYAEPIRGTDISYEDLSLRFLYWPNPAIVSNKERIKHRDCWQLRLNNPDASGSYGAALIWVDKSSGAILQMEGYDRQGKLIRRYNIVSGMKVNDAWMLKQMRIETYDPANGKRTGRTYLELDK